MECHQLRRISEEGEDTSAEIERVRASPDKYLYGYYWYTCVACFKERDGHETWEVAERVVKRPRTNKQVERSESFKLAINNVAMHFELYTADADTQKAFQELK